MNELFGEQKKDKRKEEELGIYVISPKGFILKEDLTEKEIKESEKNFLESKEKKEAVKDLIELWNKIFTFELSSENIHILTNPKEFQSTIDSFIEKKKNNISFLRDFLERKLYGLKILESIFAEKEKQIKYYETSLEDIDNLDLEKELKEEFNERKDWFHLCFLNLNELLEYTEDKIHSLG